MKSLGIYVHVPFCKQKCNYCDFLSLTTTDRPKREQYRDAMVKELEAYAKTYGKGSDYVVDTIHVGGGTPSVWEAYYLWRIVLGIKDKFNVADDVEITAEVNPGTIDVDKMSVWGVFGVNRMSIGAQSMDNDLLKTLGRIHTAEEFVNTYETARRYFYKNINVDLIFGIPGQTLEQWEDTLKKVIALDPNHVSFYSLQLEEGTPFYKMVKEGKLVPTADELDRDMYHLAVKMLTEAGYNHYEISNAAKPGFESKHNLKYWSMEEYLGLGLGAHSYLEGKRFSNTTDLEDYIANGGGVVWTYENTEADNISEYLFTGLRKVAGISLSDFEARFGKKLTDVYGKEVEKHIAGGLLVQEGDMLHLTAKGLDVANTVLCDFVEA
ncbi:MAG: oxygen-independent coproporphyrinogen III oxidase [Clostridiales bacterium]|nr:oxygen-independent coproporphyrinogen III oxidase [Clostridiales bacterium]